MKYLWLVLFISAPLFAIITIAPVEVGKKKGFSGLLKGSFETKRGNSDVDNYSAGLRARYDKEDYVLWSDFIFSYGKASGEVNTNKTYVHLRYIHTIKDVKPLNYEFFAQSETNDFTKVKNRLLAGGGLRYHYSMKKYGNLYVGLGAFDESIKYLTTNDPKENNIRINSYLSYTKEFGKRSKLSYVLYYQPNVEKFSDCIVSNGLEMTILIYEQLYVDFALYYDVDTVPAIGVKDTDVSQKTSFIYKF